MPELPELYSPPTPPDAAQRLALEAGWDRAGFGYLLEMGLGKSRTTIDNFCLLQALGRCNGLLIFAPKSVYLNWVRVSDENPGEMQKWLWPAAGVGARTYVWRAGRAKREAAEITALLRPTHDVRILVVNVEALSTGDAAYDLCWDFLSAHASMMVVDESTVAKNLDAARTKALTALSRRAKYRRILTGSPATGSPLGVFAQFELLGPGLLGHRSRYTFRARYCVLKDVYVGARTVKTEVGVKNLDELAAAMARHSFRARKRDYLDIPEKLYLPKRCVEMTPEQARVYAEMRDTAMATLRDAEQMTTNLVITQVMRLHQIACGHYHADDGSVVRLPERRTAELLAAIEETDEQVIIWSTWRDDVPVIARELRAIYGESSVAEWHGGRTAQEREAGEADFQAGRARFMLATQAAGARGRNWTAATLTAYYSNHRSLELRQQSEDRSHRRGQRNVVGYLDIIVPGTVDEKIIAALRAGADVAAQIQQDGPQAWI